MLCIEVSSPTGISPLVVVVEEEDCVLGGEVVEVIVFRCAAAYLLGVVGNDLLLKICQYAGLNALFWYIV